MLLPRVLRPLVAAPKNLFAPSTRLILPIRTHIKTSISTPISTRYLSTETIPSNEQSTPPFLEPIDSSTTEIHRESRTEKQTPTSTQLPYFINKNKLNNFSVYQKRKRGGNLIITILKGAEGDLQALKSDLRDALELQDGDIAINSVTHHIIIRGYKKKQVFHFLYTMGF
ncbi:mitochondrial large subunit ribosomal protein-domain-containing protein [Hypomontagnella monticulosa]|nr:mitochondrial large subunit ribosomal protein-domain-containing protein [Hypomontagnella monticulosa]